MQLYLDWFPEYYVKNSPKSARAFERKWRHKMDT